MYEHEEDHFDELDTPTHPTLPQIFLVSFLASSLVATILAVALATALGHAYAELEDIDQIVEKLHKSGACGGTK